MTRYLPLLILAGIAAEIASIIWVGQAFGVLVTLLLLLAGGVAGISLIKGAGANLASALHSPVRGATFLQGLAGQTLSLSLAGLFFLIPGFFSDFMGLLLLLPPIRRWLGSKFRVESRPKDPARSRRFDTVIEAEAVEITAEIERPRPPEPER